MLTEAQRDRLADELRVLDEAAEPIAEAMKPLRAAAGAIEEMRDVVLERYGLTEILGACPSCKRLMIPGDRGYAYEDQEDRAAFEERLATHLAAGGSLDDKVTYVL